MLRLFRSPAVARRLLSRGLTQTCAALGPQVTTNLSAAATQVPLDRSLDDLTAGSFSEASVFPDLAPEEDTLLSQTQPKLEVKMMAPDAHALAQEELAAKMERYCAASDFPEYSGAEESVEMAKK